MATIYKNTLDYATGTITTLCASNINSSTTNITITALSMAAITSTNLMITGTNSFNDVSLTNVTVGNLNVTGTTNLVATTVSNIRVTGLLTSGSKYTLASTFATYGDSYTAGSGSESSTTWPAMLATLSGFTAVNNASGGTCIDFISAGNPTPITNVVNNAAYNDYSFITAYGFNDVRNDSALYNETNLYQWYIVYLNAIMTMAMKQENIYGARTAGWTEVGTWANTAANSYGRSTIVNGVTSTKTITGRYYMFSFIVHTAATALNWIIQIDGVTKDTIKFNYRTAQNTYYSICCVIDMGSTAARSCKVTNNIGNTTQQFFEFCAAWDSASSFRNVLCCSIPMFDFTYTGGAPWTAGTQSKWNSMNTLIQKAVITCQNLGLPVYFYNDTNMNCFASDGYHWSDGSYYQRAYGIYYNL